MSVCGDDRERGDWEWFFPGEIGVGNVVFGVLPYNLTNPEADAEAARREEREKRRRPIGFAANWNEESETC